VGALLILVTFVFAILAQGFFGSRFERFETVMKASFSLFQIMTLDDWANDFAKPIGDVYPLAWVFFLFFILVVSLGLLNLLTGVFLKALLDITEENKKAETERLSKAKKELLKVISAVFYEFDEDGGSTPTPNLTLTTAEFLTQNRIHNPLGNPILKTKVAPSTRTSLAGCSVHARRIKGS